MLEHRRGLYSLVDWNFTAWVIITVILVEAYTASWIEMQIVNDSPDFLPMSRLIQPRGLKYNIMYYHRHLYRRGLYSLVDWNITECVSRQSIVCRGLYSLVDWNYKTVSRHIGVSGRGLYSLVDWNMIFEWCLVAFMSRLIQPRGLKYHNLKNFTTIISRRGLYSLVDWNLT